MSKISEKQAEDIMKGIKKYQQQREKINKSIEAMLFHPENIDFQLGGNLVDSLIDVLEVAFNDDLELFQWYVFVSEFGKKGSIKRIHGSDVEIDSVKAIIEILNKKNEKSKDTEGMRKAYKKRRLIKPE